MTRRTGFLGGTLIAAPAGAAVTVAISGRVSTPDPVAARNLSKDRLAEKGYDVVAYFATRGVKTFPETSAGRIVTGSV
jgi:hypothetical protein